MRSSTRVLCILAVALLVSAIDVTIAANNQRGGLQKPAATNQQQPNRLHAPTANTKLVSDSVTNLAARIANALSNQKSKTEIFSPVSIAGALSLLLLGSGGQTQQELLSVMGLNRGQLSFQEIHMSFGRLFQDLVSNDPSLEPLVTWRMNDKCNRYDEDEDEDEEGLEQSQPPSNPNEYPSHQISVANGLFLQRGYNPGKRFLQLAKTIYQGTVTDLEFERDSSGAAAFINDWCTNATNGKIKEIVTENNVRDTRLIVANALYFKAKWETTFSPYGTRQRAFYPDGKQEPEIGVETMATTGCFPYYNATAEFDLQIIGLPYERGLSTMYIILPNESNRQKIRDKLRLLEAPQLNWLIDRMVVRKGRVMMPKLNISNRIQLSSILQGLQVRDLFDPVHSNLSEIFNNKGTDPIVDSINESETIRPLKLHNRVDVTDAPKERPTIQKPTTNGPVPQQQTAQRPQNPPQGLSQPRPALPSNAVREILLKIPAQDCQLIENCQYTADGCQCNRIPTEDRSTGCGVHVAKHYYDNTNKRCMFSIDPTLLPTYICLKPSYQPVAPVNSRAECERRNGCKMLLNACYCCKYAEQVQQQTQYQPTASSQPILANRYDQDQTTYNAGQMVTNQRVPGRVVQICTSIPTLNSSSNCQSYGFSWVDQKNVCVDMRSCTKRRIQKRQAPPAYYTRTVTSRQVLQPSYQASQQQQTQSVLQQRVRYQPQLQSRFEQEQQQPQQYAVQPPQRPQVMLQSPQQAQQAQRQQQILQQVQQQQQIEQVQRQPQLQQPIQQVQRQPQQPIQRQQQPQLPQQSQQFVPPEQRQPSPAYESVYVNEVITQVTLDVNEQGTEGGAVTAALIDRIGPDYSFVVDSPFLIFIRNDKTRLPLFYGVVYDPRPYYPPDYDPAAHEISLANGIFVQRTIQVSDAYRNQSSLYYNSEVQSLDFEQDAVGSTKQINAWVSEKTHGKLPNILPSTLPPSSIMVLASAMYFKALWAETFIDGATKLREFYPNGKDKPSVMVEMMAHGGCFPFYESPELDARIIGLPYKNNLTTMYVIMPNDSNRAKVQRLIPKLTSDTLSQMIDRMTIKTSIILFPKMHVSNTVDLKRVLQQLGVSSLFKPERSNLSAMLQEPAAQTDTFANRVQGGAATVPPPMTPAVNIPTYVSRPSAGLSYDLKEMLIFPRVGNETEEVTTDVPATETTEPLTTEAVPQTVVPLTKQPRKGGRSRRDVSYKVPSTGKQHAPAGPLTSKDFILNKRIVKESGPVGKKGLRRRSKRAAQQLYVSNAVHQVDLEVNETGTEGGAATIVTLNRSGTSIVFRAEAPFLLLVRNDRTGLPLFYGPIYHPSS